MTQFLRDQAIDSEEVVTPLMLDGTYLSRNFATLGPMIRQPPCDFLFFIDYYVITRLRAPSGCLEERSGVNLWNKHEIEKLLRARRWQTAGSSFVTTSRDDNKRSRSWLRNSSVDLTDNHSLTHGSSWSFLHMLLLHGRAVIFLSFNSFIFKRFWNP